MKTSRNVARRSSSGQIDENRPPDRPHSSAARCNIIHRTAPWTLPANVAVCLHPDLEYGFFDTGEEYLLIAKGVKEHFQEGTALTLKDPETYFTGKDFEFEKEIRATDRQIRSSEALLFRLFIRKIS